MYRVLKKSIAATLISTIGFNSWGQAPNAELPTEAVSASPLETSIRVAPDTVKPKEASAASLSEGAATTDATNALPESRTLTNPSSPLDTVPSAAAMAATTPTPELVLPKVGAQYTHSGNNKSPPTETYIVTRDPVQRAAALQIGIAVLSLLTFRGAGFSAITKESLPGVPIKPMVNRENLLNTVATTYPKSLERSVHAAMLQMPEFADKTFKYPLLITGLPRLIYESLSGDPEVFQLHVDATVSKFKENRSFFAAPTVSVACSEVTPKVGLPLTAWAENDFALVKTELDAVLQRCTEKVIAQLPSMLKE